MNSGIDELNEYTLQSMINPFFRIFEQNLKLRASMSLPFGKKQLDVGPLFSAIKCLFNCLVINSLRKIFSFFKMSYRVTFRVKFWKCPNPKLCGRKLIYFFKKIESWKWKTYCWPLTFLNSTFSQVCSLKTVIDNFWC